MLNYDDIAIVSDHDAVMDAIGDAACLDMFKSRFFGIIDEFIQAGKTFVLQHITDEIPKIDMYNDNGSLFIQTEPEREWKILNVTKNELLTHILTRVISENLEFIQTAFPNGIYSNIVLTGDSRRGSKVCEYALAGPDADLHVSPENYKQHAAALYWMSNHYKDIDTHKSIYISVMPLIHDANETIRNLYRLLTELSHYPATENIGIDKRMFRHLCECYAQHHDIPYSLISDIRNYTYTIPVSEALYFLNQLHL